MALQDLLQISKSKQKMGISEERIEAIKPALRQYIAFWREYPDMFIDFLQTGADGTIPNDGLKFYFYQRVFLRVSVRYRQVYAVFPRGYSKSFLAVLSLMIRCILYPGAKLFTSAGGKSQSASILKEKVDELCRLVPALGREIDRRPKKTQESKDKCIYVFKNGSYFDNVAANEKARGGRRHAGVLEECVGIDGKILQEVLIPMMSISRKCLDGTKQKDEALNKAELYIIFFWTKRYKLFSLNFHYNKGDEIMYYIYKIENLINHKKYIGLTNNIQRRYLRHFSDLKRGCHDNSFLQKEYNLYGKENFSFDMLFQGDVTYQEIGEQEKYYIKLYDSFHNGYNQNEGGNFGPANGGTHLTEADVINILSALEFMSRPGQILSDMFGVTKTTISRIKHGFSHSQYKEKYDTLPYEQRKAIYELFCETTDFYTKKVQTTIIKSNRRMTQEQVFMVLVNEELGRKIPLKRLARWWGFDGNALSSILKGKSYKDYILEYNKLTLDQKEQIVSLLSNQQEQTS